ncbi:unnamed protein product [Ilex paraguariensis]|uniref:Transcription repressor n=1 Tax=Ilex paraguariensis TaxID=185542 RepID=A0ABC8TTI3_9AQUA
MFRSSFGSCRSKNISDVIEQPVFAPHNRQHYQLIDLFSSKPRPFSPVCRPKWPETDEPEHRFTVNKNLFPRSKVSKANRHSLLVPGDFDGRKCPPVSPISPLNTFSEFQEFEAKPMEKKTRKMKKKTHLKNKKFDTTEFSSCKYNGWFSSDEDDDETTLFSSKSLSLSSDSSDSFARNKARFCDKSPKTRRRRTAKKFEFESESESEKGPMPLKGKVRDSFAVVKRSSDPYNDFRASMVEMIIEKQIFSAKDLENLLQCFLSLNSYHNHRIIIEVFCEC